MFPTIAMCIYLSLSEPEFVEFTELLEFYSLVYFFIDPKLKCELKNSHNS